MKRLNGYWVAAWAATFVLGTATIGAAQDDAMGRRLAGELELMARQALAVKPNPDEHQSAIAATLLAEATRYAPKDSNLWRLRIEAADLAGDTKALRTALGSYLKANPSDDAAQLRLIDLIVSEKDTAEQRLETYGRLLEGPSAASLSAPLRSRVAARAALLARELGDRKVYTKWLKMAVSLDTTNRGAMGEILTILAEKPTTTEVEHAQALMLLYGADPMNVELRWQVAARLHRCGLYEQALEWFGSAQLLGTRMGAGVTNADRVGDWALCLWGAGKAKDAIGLVDSYQNAMTQQAAAQLKAAGKEVPEGVVQIPARLLTIRGSLYRELENEEAADADATALLAVVDAGAKAEDASAHAITQAAWARLYLNQRINLVSALIDRAANAGADEATIARMRGWLAVRQGDTAKAIETVEGHADSDPLCALALAEALRSDEAAKERRVTLLQRTYAADPSSLAARVAATHLNELDVRPKTGEACATIGRVIAQTPAALRQLGVTQSSPIRVRVEPVKRSIDYGEPIEVDVSVVNTLATAVSLGAGSTVPSTVFVVPSIQVDAKQQPASLQPVIVNLGRRITLGPNESVKVRVQLTSPPLMSLLRMRPDRTVRINAVAVLDPRVGPGGIVPGPLGASVPGPPMARMAMAITPQNVDKQLEVLNGEDPAAAATAASWLSLLVGGVAEDAPADQVKRADEIAARVVRAYKKFNTAQRAYLLARLVQQPSEKSRLSPVIDMAVASEDPVIQYALMMTQVDGESSTILESALRRKHTPEGEFAAHVRSLWKDIEAAREEAKKRSEEADSAGTDGNAKAPAIEPEK